MNIRIEGLGEVEKGLNDLVKSSELGIESRAKVLPIITS